VIAGTVLYWRRPRTDPARAALLLWGGWLAVHFIVFSFSSGTMHPYYTAALAPAIAALTGIGAVTLFRASRWSRVWGCVLVFGIAATGAWSFAILRRTPSWNPWLGWTVVGLAAVAAIAVLCRLAARLGQRSITRLAVLTAVGGLLAGIAGPAAYAVSAASSRTNGTNPLAGPSAGGFGMGGSGMGGGLPAGGRTSGGRDRAQADGSGGRPGGGSPRMGEIDAQLLSYLEKNQGSATWLVAVSNSQSAASIILQTGEPAISMFGFTGSDHAMTVQTLQEYVKAGKLRYVVIGGGGGFQGGGETASGVTSWVQENCTTVPASVYGEASSSAGNSQTLYRCD
jgi:4-amino-4-deoxy-L-arabinose transferase-like glycosyltransferase